MSEADPVLKRILEQEMELPSQMRVDAVLLKPPGFSHPIRLERADENLWVLIYGTSEREILFMNRTGLEKLKNIIEKELLVGAETIDLRGKTRSMKDICEAIQKLVDRTEIEWLELSEGILRYKPISEVPPTGNGPIKNLIAHLMSLEPWLKEDEGRLLIRVTAKGPGEATLVIWLPKLMKP